MTKPILPEATDATDAARYRSVRAEIIACNGGADIPEWVQAKTEAEVDAIVDRNIELSRH